MKESIYWRLGEGNDHHGRDKSSAPSRQGGAVDDAGDEREVVLNRARLYHDRRDFYIQDGDTGMREDYPGPPWWMKRDEPRSDDNDDN